MMAPAEPDSISDGLRRMARRMKQRQIADPIRSPSCTRHPMIDFEQLRAGIETL